MKQFQGEVKILHLIEGAKMAEGLTVIIDVFRAFSLECYLYDMGVKEIRPVGTVTAGYAALLRMPHILCSSHLLQWAFLPSLPHRGY